MPLLFSIVLEVLATAIKERKEVNGIQIGKELKLSVFADDMILYIKELKDTTIILLELINENGKVADYKINTQKSVHFYTKNERPEREIQETIQLTTASKRIKYLRINLPKETKDLYSKNYKIFIKEVKEDTIKWKDILCLWIRVVNIVKMTILPKATTDSIQSLSNYQWHFSQN